MSITGLVLISGSVLLIGNDVVFSPWKALWPTLAALVIAAPMSPVNSLFLAKTAMTWIGQRSYPIYLWHWPPIVFYKTIFDSDPSLPVAVAMLLCIVAISHLTYRFVERPFRATSASSVVPLMSRIAVPFLVTSSLALALFGSLAWHSYLYDGCGPLGTSLRQRTTGDRQSPYNFPQRFAHTLLLFGDSYMEQYIPGTRIISPERS